MDTDSWQAQLRKGAAEFVVLALIEKAEAYGLQILNEANRAGSLVAEGALYPLLNRLERDGKIVSRWSLDQGAAHPRKYYRLSPAGGRLVTEMRSVWIVFRTAITAVVEQPT